MVVRFVLEQEQPILFLTVHITLDLDGAGVDFFTLVKILQHAALFERLGGNGAHIHQGAVLLLAAGLGPQCHIAVKSGLNHGIVNLNVIQNRAEGRVAAVVGPVSVNQANLGDGRVAVLGLEIFLAEHNVRVVHRKALLNAERFERRVIEREEAGQRLNTGGNGKFHLEGVAHLKGCLARFHGVDNVLLDGLQIFCGEVALEQIDAGAAHIGALALAEQLNALGGGVCALVKLTGQILHRKHGLCRRQFVIGHIHRRFAEHGGDGFIKQFTVNAFHVIAVEQAQTLEVRNADKLGQLVQQSLRFAVKAGLFFYINTIYH